MFRSASHNLLTQCTVGCKICSHLFFYRCSNKNVKLFDGALFISKYLLFIGYIPNALTVNFHSIFSIVRNSSAPVTNDHRGVTGETVMGPI